jgi:hypothetical protein
MPATLLIIPVVLGPMKARPTELHTVVPADMQAWKKVELTGEA